MAIIRFGHVVKLRKLSIFFSFCLCLAGHNSHFYSIESIVPLWGIDFQFHRIWTENHTFHMNITRTCNRHCGLIQIYLRNYEFFVTIKYSVTFKWIWTYYVNEISMHRNWWHFSKFRNSIQLNGLKNFFFQQIKRNLLKSCDCWANHLCCWRYDSKYVIENGQLYLRRSICCVFSEIPGHFALIDQKFMAQPKSYKESVYSRYRQQNIPIKYVNSSCVYWNDRRFSLKFIHDLILSHWILIRLIRSLNTAMKS